MGQDPIDAAINGRSEIGSAAVAITMVDVVVFLPIAFLSGIVGAYLKEYALVVVVATMFSLFVSFTLTPLLAAKWSVVRRSVARPKWMDMFRNPKLDVALVLLGIGLSWVPNNFTKLGGIFLIALVILNVVVQRYDQILEWYRTKALPFGLAHGFFVVFVCGMLLLNAFLLVSGGIVSAKFDVGVIAILGFGVLLGLMLRAIAGKSDLSARYSMNGAGAVSRAEHAVGDTVMNVLRFFVRSVRAFGTNIRMTIATFAIPAVLAILMPLLGQITFDFVPAIQTGSINMTVTYPPGTPIATTARYVDQLENAILKIDGIKDVSSTVGQKPFGWGNAVGGNYAQLNADTLDSRRKDTNKIIEQIRKLDYLAPGGKFEVAGDTGGGSGTPIFYSLSGPADKIDAAAEKVANVLRNTPGSVNVETSSEVAAPRLNVNIDRAKAAILGVSPGDAALAARIAVDGAVATKVRTDTGLVDVRVQFPLAQRSTVADLQNVRVRAQDGTMVPLSDVAEFQWTKAPTKIDRLNRERVVNIFGSNLPNYSLGAVTAPLEKDLKQPGFLPSGVAVTAQGDTQYMMETMQNMGLALLTSFMLVYMLMVVLYGSFLEPLIVMFSVPLAIIGAFVALALMHKIDPNGGQSLNLLSMLGIVMLFGLVAKNGILMVDYSNTLIKRGMRVRDAVITASSTRFRPILMTTSAMVFGMLPLAIGLSEGGEWRQAMGTVIIGGLLSSLILTLFLVPMIYTTWIGHFERMADARAVRAELQPVAEGSPAT